jgi:hypothetical protein
MQSALNMHQAAGIANHECGRLCDFQVLYLALEHLSRKLRMFDRKYSAKTAAILSFWQFSDVGSAHI